MGKRLLIAFLLIAYILTNSHINANNPVIDGYACLNTFALSAELELEVDQETDFLTIKNRKCVKLEDCSSFCYRTNLTCTTDDNHRSPTGHVYQKAYAIYRRQDGFILESECCKTQTVRALNCSTRRLNDDGKMSDFKKSGSYFVRSMNWTAVEVCKAVPVSPSLSMACSNRRVPEYNDEILRHFASEPGTQVDGISTANLHTAPNPIHSQLPEPYRFFDESPLTGAAESSVVASNAISSSSAVGNSAVSGSAIGSSAIVSSSGSAVGGAAAGTAGGVAGGLAAGGAAGLSQLGLIGLNGLLGLLALMALDSTTTMISTVTAAPTTLSATTQEATTAIPTSTSLVLSTTSSGFTSSATTSSSSLTTSTTSTSSATTTSSSMTTSTSSTSSSPSSSSSSSTTSTSTFTSSSSTSSTTSISTTTTTVCITYGSACNPLEQRCCTDAVAPSISTMTCLTFSGGSSKCGCFVSSGDSCRKDIDCCSGTCDLPTSKCAIGATDTICSIHQDCVSVACIARTTTISTCQAPLVTRAPPVTLAP